MPNVFRVVLVEQDQGAEDRQAGLARLLGEGVDVGEQLGVELGVEPVVPQGRVVGELLAVLLPGPPALAR